MKNLIQKFLKKFATLSDDHPFSDKKINYKAINNYLLEINLQDSLEEMVSETAKCLKNILNYQLFILAITEKNNHEIWSDPVLSKKTITEILENDFRCPDLFKINYINNTDKKIITTVFNKPAALESYEVTTVDHRIKLYLKHENNNSDIELETVNIIIQAFGNALTNMLKIKQLETDASTDHLTGCYNRRSFNNLISHNMDNSRRYKRDLSVILLDIDYFKKVNDTYGHQSGDEVLKAISKAVQSFIRKGDYLSRYGGEEFVVVLPETKKSYAIDIANRLKTTIESLKIATSDNHTIRVTASYGIAALQPGSDIDSLMSEADSMLYKAKANGRNCVMPERVVFDLKKESAFPPAVISAAN